RAPAGPEPDKADDGPRDDAHGPFRTAEEARDVVRSVVAGCPGGGPHDGAVGQYQLERFDVVGRDPVLERVGPARILGDVAADRGRTLARRIGGEVVAAFLRHLSELEVDDASLDQG